MHYAVYISLTNHARRKGYCHHLLRINDSLSIASGMSAADIPVTQAVRQEGSLAVDTSGIKPHKSLNLAFLVGRLPPGYDRVKTGDHYYGVGAVDRTLQEGCPE